MNARTSGLAPALFALLLSGAASAAPPSAKPRPAAPAPKAPSAPSPIFAASPEKATTPEKASAALENSSDTKTPSGGGGGLGAVGALVGLGVLVGGGVLIAKRRSGSGGSSKRPPEPILPKRTFDWEMRMTEEQELAMLRGVEAYRDAGHSLLFYHEDALIWFYRPYLLVSVNRLTDDFLAAGPAAVADPIGAVRSILQGYVAMPSNGVLHHTKDWYFSPLGDLDYAKCGSLFYDILTSPKPYISGTQGSSLNEDTGQMTVKVDVEGRLNVFCVNLGALLQEVLTGRAANPSAELADLVRQPLIAIARGVLPGGMWTRGAASPGELALVEQIVSTSAPRQPSA